MAWKVFLEQEIHSFQAKLMGNSKNNDPGKYEQETKNLQEEVLKFLYRIIS